MNEGYSSRFVFRYGTALTAMGQVCDSLATSLIASEISVCLPCVHINLSSFLGFFITARSIFFKQQTGVSASIHIF